MPPAQKRQNDQLLCVSFFVSINEQEQESRQQIHQKPMRKSELSNLDVIFYSDEEVEQFQVDKNYSEEMENDVEKYLDEILGPIKLEKKVFQEDMGRESNSGKREIQTSIQESIKPFSNFQDQQEEDSDDSEFSVNENGNNGKIPKVGRKIRSSNQNICKKYHTLANRCLRKLQIYKYLSPYIKHVHKRNYFIFVLIACQKTNKLPEFVELYQESANSKAAKCRQAMKDSFHGSKKYKQNKQYLEAILQSLEALSAFEKGSLYESLKLLFDVTKMKRISWLQLAYEQVKTFGEKFPVN